MRLPSGRGNTSSRCALPRFSRFRRPLGSNLRSGGGAIAAGVGPLPWYSKRPERRFLRILSVLIWPENGKGLGILLDPF